MNRLKSMSLPKRILVFAAAVIAIAVIVAVIVVSQMNKPNAATNDFTVTQGSSKIDTANLADRSRMIVNSAGKTVEVYDYQASFAWKSADNEDIYSYVMNETTTNPSGAKVYNYAPVTGVINRCLNVYPRPAGNQMKTWMENPSYGENGKAVTNDPITNQKMIGIDGVSIVDFNRRPDYYLKYQTQTEVNAAKAAGYLDAKVGDYKYDSIFFGSWDYNGNEATSGDDLSATAATSTLAFGDTGKGVIIGHDTALTYHPNFMKIGAPKLGLYNSATQDGPTSLDVHGVGSTKVKLLDAMGTGDPIIMKFPHKMEINQVFTIPRCHVVQSYAPANANTWMKFEPPFTVYGAEGTTNVEKTSEGYNNNFYLITGKGQNSNYAMIQTGHSKSATSLEERKIIANLLMYISKFKNAPQQDVYTINDKAAPNVPNIALGGGTQDLKSVAVAFSAEDNATTITYALNQKGEKYGLPQTVTTTNGLQMRSGTAKYIYEIDDNNTTVPGVTRDNLEQVSNTNTVPAGQNINVDISSYELASRWLHVRAVDRSGNVGETAHIRLRDLIDNMIFVQYKDKNGNDIKEEAVSAVEHGKPYSVSSTGKLTATLGNHVGDDYHYWCTQVNGGEKTTDKTVSWNQVLEDQLIVFTYAPPPISVSIATADSSMYTGLDKADPDFDSGKHGSVAVGTAPTTLSEQVLSTEYNAGTYVEWVVDEGYMVNKMSVSIGANPVIPIYLSNEEGKTGYVYTDVACTQRLEVEEDSVSQGIKNVPVIRTGNKITIPNVITEIHFNMSFKEYLTSFTITKTLNKPAEQDQKFVFRVEYKNNSAQAGAVARTMNATITIKSGENTGTVKFEDVQMGWYTVTELDYNWKYSLDTAALSTDNPGTIISGSSVTDNAQKSEKNYRFKNNQKDVPWAGDSSAVVNDMPPIN